MADNYLITGYWGEPHVTAENDRGIQAAMFGSGRFVLPVGNQFRAEYIGNNTVRIYDGKLMDNGAAAGIPVGKYVDVLIATAGQGMKRNDLIVFQYSQDSSTLIESGTFVVVQGEQTSGTAKDPTLTQNDLLSGTATFDQMALWRVSVSGTTISAPVKLFSMWTERAGNSVEGKKFADGTVGGDQAEIFNDFRDRTTSTTEGVTIATAGNVATGAYSHAEGSATTASAINAHAEGYSTTASSNNAHAEGRITTASGSPSHAEGNQTVASGYCSHTEGNTTTASGSCAHAEGHLCEATATNTHAEGYKSKATANQAHAEGYVTTVSGVSAHGEGAETTASGNNSHAEGKLTKALGNSAHAEGYSTTAGSSTGGNYAHAEGSATTASGEAAHAEGTGTKASGDFSHAEGNTTTASGSCAHAEGNAARAVGDFSHAAGFLTFANGVHSHASGYCTVANDNQFAIGKFNTDIQGATIGNQSPNETLFIIGNGYDGDHRHNALRVTGEGACRAHAIESSGADYARYYEWADGNPDGEDRRGLFVVLDGAKIRIANEKDDLRDCEGIVSANPAYVENAPDDWHGKYMTDVFGGLITEEVVIPEYVVREIDEETGEETTKIIPEHTVTRYVQNPEYDSTQEYVTRDLRKEWSPVGFSGFIVAVDDGTCEANGYCTVGAEGKATKSAEWTNIRVLERKDDTHILVRIK